MEVFVYSKVTDKIIERIQGITSIHTIRNLICFHDKNGYKTVYNSDRVKCTIYFN